MWIFALSRCSRFVILECEFYWGFFLASLHIAKIHTFFLSDRVFFFFFGKISNRNVTLLFLLFIFNKNSPNTVNWRFFAHLGPS